MSDDAYCVPRHVPTCDQVIESEQTKAPCPTWRFCLPWGGSLAQNSGGCVEYTSPRLVDIPEDGIYDKIIIADGCIVGVEKAGIPVYQASPCAPVPTDCEGGDGGGINPSPMGCNILRVDANGRPYVCVSIQGENGIDVSGTGTPEDPIIITGNGGGGGERVYVQAGNDGISVTGDGPRANPYRVSHKESAAGIQTAMGLSIDRYGHIVGYTDDGNKGLQAILPGEGINVENDPQKGTATVSLAPVIGITPGEHRVANWVITVDEYGRVTSLRKEWTVTPHTFRVDCVDYTVNQDGLISSIRDLPADECSSGGGGYTDLKGHLVRFISVTDWNGRTYNGATGHNATNVASFIGFSSDGTTLEKEYDNIELGPTEADQFQGRANYYDINFTMAESSALFFRFWGYGSWTSTGDTESPTPFHMYTRWIADLDGARIVDSKEAVPGTCVMVRTRDVYSAGQHTLRIYPRIHSPQAAIMQEPQLTVPTGVVEIMTTALRG